MPRTPFYEDYMGIRRMALRIKKEREAAFQKLPDREKARLRPRTLPVPVQEAVKRGEKRLFEVLRDEADWGVGKLVTRVLWQTRYPEPCYWRLTKVVPDELAEERDFGEAWGVRTWRGICENAERQISDANKTHGWWIVPPEKEGEFCTIPEDSTYADEKKAPYEVPVPPLLRAMILAERERKGQDLTEPMMRLSISKKASNRASQVSWAEYQQWLKEKNVSP
ncbi:PREDICTED: 28S ribosomal protein S34, mitochondrial-like [Branchiostoma belcheri]|uniref:28S ribosomal protein S34, mitochondrial-like n=1 Tax=Branchiostoma belcheri TaxID=7741 RepID=A0A6P5AXC4_BRABE|nr:PREDICTED: 28S ribosomal protein S34, mitochondrial-like [Branchiostoma belcheri]